MLRYYGLLIYFLFSFHSAAQQVDLDGTVSIHNSGYHTNKVQFLENVLISAPFSKPGVSDAHGHFKLTVVGIPTGTNLKLSVEKQGYEIVNSKMLEHVVLGSKAQVHVFLIEKGGLIAAQLELLNISKAALYQRRDSIIQVLRSDQIESEKMIKSLEERFQQEITNREVAEQLLNSRIYELEKQLPAFTLKLAQQNLDYASDIYIAAYEYFLEGDIEKVIQLLNNKTLSEITQNAKEQLNKGNELKEQGEEIKRKAIQQLEENIRNYELRAEMFLLRFDYEKAIEAYDSILYIMEQNEFDPLRISLTYDYSAQLQFQLLDQMLDRDLDYDYDEIQIKIDKLILYQQKALDLGLKELSDTDTQLATLYSHSSEVLMKYCDLESSAFDCITEVVTILSNGTVNSPEEVDALVEVGAFMGEFSLYVESDKESEEYKETSEVCYGMAIDFCEELEDPEQQLGEIYSQMSSEIWLSRNERIECLEMSNNFFRNALDSLDPILAKSNADLGDVLMHSEPDKSLGLLKEASSIYEHVQALSTYDFYYQERIETYQNIAVCYRLKGDYDSAVVYHHKNIEAIEKASLSDLDWFSRYDLLIRFYTLIEDYEQVIFYNHKYLEEEKKKGIQLNWHDFFLDNLVEAYTALNDYDSAHYYLTELMEMNKETNASDVLSSTYVYYRHERAIANLELEQYAAAINDGEAVLSYYCMDENLEDYVLESVEIRSLLADSYEQLGEFDSTLVHLEKLKKMRRHTRDYNEDWRKDRKEDKKRIKKLKM